VVFSEVGVMTRALPPRRALCVYSWGARRCPPVQVDVHESHVCAEARSHLGCLRADHTATQDKNISPRSPRYPAEQDPSPS
jgi:hypothetical protein